MNEWPPKTQVAALLIFLPMTMLSLPVLITSSSSNLIQSQIKNDPNNYDLCAPFPCGNITFNFPFSRFDEFGKGPYDCGLPGFQILCDSATKSNSTPRIMLSNRPYQVKKLFLSVNDSVMTVVDHELINEVRLNSCSSLGNLTIPITHDTIGFANLTLAKGGVNLTIFKCTANGAVDLRGGFPSGIVGNYSCGGGEWAYVWDGTQRDPRRPGHLAGCPSVSLPISGASLVRLRSNSSDGGGDGQKLVADVLGYGFELQWTYPQECATCREMDGRCGYDGSAGRIVCFCKGGCGGGGNAFKWKVIAGAVAGSIFALVSVAVVLRLKYKTRSSAFFKLLCWRRNQTAGDERNAKEFIKSYQSTLLTNYSYKDIKKMTNGFKEKLGEGSYGNVFKGEFSDGRPIAVKMLDNYKDNNNDNFLNEVNTIGRIHHVNIIRLLGFCWDGSKQALIYEYMPNKSLGDLVSNASLGLPRLLEIATGVAHGLEYLHNGCDSRILHLDIKPQNVLLDENFNPKISDFGLAKVYARNQSAVTMTGARGTVGFIAPEVFMRNLGNPSHKSDIYSFGMLLLDMVGANKQIEPDLNTSSSGAYFPGWIHDKLVEERGMEFDQDSSTIVGEEVFVARKMVMVGLWCIQINPRDRPSMSRVIEMLSGDVEAIEMPPKPLFLSPPRLQLHDGIITSIESESSVLPLTGDSETKSNE